MNMSLQPIKLYSHSHGPNPWKVAIILEELNVPYENAFLKFPEMKSAPFTDINPNGRVPAILDPNTGINLWESAAIIEYLISTYDFQTHRLSFPQYSTEYWLCKQWLAFQISGQGPYYGQGVHFTNYHSENVPSARERYKREIERVIMVIDTHLQKRSAGTSTSTSTSTKISEKPPLAVNVNDNDNVNDDINPSLNLSLVGDKLSFVDLCFVPWGLYLDQVFNRPGEPEALEEIRAKYSFYTTWFENMVQRPSVVKVWQHDRKKAVELLHQ